MAQDMYDAYGSENVTMGQMAGQTAKDIATSPFRMSTYAGLYTSWPGMWSIGKGVYIPYIGKTLEKGGMSAVATGAKSLITQAYSQKGFWGGVKGTGRLAKTVGSRLMILGMTESTGGGYVGGKWLGSKSLSSDAQQFYNRVYPEIRKIYENSGTIVKNVSSVSKPARKAARAATQAAILGDKRMTLKFGKGMGTVFDFGDTSKLVGKKMFKSTALKTTTKIGLGIAKGASLIGGAMMAWDLISMVGVPLGRAAIRGLDNVMGEYQRRFMPEVGGRLEMSYLSQGAATERQRAVQAISKAYINGRSAFGSEANYLHQ